MKQIIRAFALGILTTTLLLGVIYFFEDDQNDEQTTTENNIVSTEEMIEELESQGYTITEEIETTPNNQDLSENDAQDEISENETEDDTTIPETYSLTIESGMTISQVADSLESANIIEDRETFITYLNDNDYGTNIQVGEFELNTEMTLQEVADTIANQN